jgi:CubicO group peptidase (beta-lactamase class C family)
MRRLNTGLGVGLLALLLGCAGQRGAQRQGMEAGCTTLRVQGPGALTTDSGLRFEVPAGFTAVAECEVVSLDSDEFDLWLVELGDMELGAAIDAAWSRVAPDFAGRVDSSREPPASPPWDAFLVRNYVADEAELIAQAVARKRGDSVYVHLVRATAPVLDKRAAQLRTFIGSMKVPGAEEEDLSGVSAGSVRGETESIDALIAEALAETGTPGLALAVIEDGAVVYTQGYGVRRLGAKAAVDADTLMMIGSVTKSLTTLMMASLVDAGELAWQRKVQAVTPQFSLGDAELAARLEVQHLVCACAGLPRKDMPLILEYEGKGPDDVFAELAQMEPSTGFKETFQYQNHMVAAGGYVAALAVAPEADPGATYRALMRERVFAPMGMRRTTLALERAVADANHARPHAQALDGTHQPIALDHERFVDYVAPSGAIWSSAAEMARYVITELNGGRAPDGTRVVSRTALEKRWQPQVAMAKDVAYGLGWVRAKKKGLRLLTHGGGTMGFATKVTFYPDAQRGFVMIANGTGGHLVESIVGRRLFEIWFGGDEKVAEQLAYAVEAQRRERDKALERCSRPAADWIAPLLGDHVHPELGVLSIERSGDAIELDAGNYRSTLLRYDRPDGKVSLTCTAPPLAGIELVLPADDGGEEPDTSLILTRGQERYELKKPTPGDAG